MQQIGVAVVGVGFMGEVHARAYARNPSARLVGLYDLRTRRTAAIAAELETRAYPSIEELLDDPAVAAVSICTSDAQHLAPTLAAMQRGTHVLLEKPIATTMADADRIVAAAEASGGTLLMGHIVRFDPRYARVKQLVDAGELGELETVFARRLNNVASQQVLGGRVSPLMFLGVHDLDYVRWLAGSEAVRVFAESESRVMRQQGYQIDDMVFVLIRFANGVIGCVEAGFILPDTHPRGGDFKIEAIGTRGVANIDLVEQGLQVSIEGQAHRRPSFGHSIDEEIAHFLACVDGAVTPLIGARDGRAALELVLAAERAASTHSVVLLPLKE